MTLAAQVCITTLDAQPRMPRDRQNDERVKLSPVDGAMRLNQSSFTTPRLARLPVIPVSPDALKDSHSNIRRTSRNSTEPEYTPKGSTLPANITPRSGPRKARVGGSVPSTPGSTPRGTPSGSRPTSVIAGSTTSTPGTAYNVHGLGLRGAGFSKHTRTGSNSRTGDGSPNGFSPTGGPLEGVGAKDEASSMFFFASEAKAQSGRSILANTETKLQSSGFVYANGELERGNMPKPESPTLYAPKALSITKSSQVVSPSNRPNAVTPSNAANRPAYRPTAFSPTANSGPVRVPSPLKEFETIGKDRDFTSPRSSTSASGRQSTQSSSKSPNAQVATGQTSSRPILAGEDSNVNQKSPTEANNVEALVLKVLQKLDPSALEDPKPNPSKAHPLLSPAQRPASPLAMASPPTSPTRAFAIPAGSKIDQANALAANARRERKVLDLEISNSSLLAINRTLEREMRKQTAELRRYRRLTSAGRISINSVSASRLSIGPDGENDISDIEEEDSLSEDDDEEDDSLASPTAQAEHDARLRAKDEKRLQLDLSKHRELLLDSQRMNQSLKRCLGWTEELIAEGRKALEYQVRVSDIEVGGRVLPEDEVDPDVSQRRGLLSPARESAESPWTASDDCGNGGKAPDLTNHGMDLPPLPQLEQHKEDTREFARHLDHVEGSPEPDW